MGALLWIAVATPAVLAFVARLSGPRAGSAGAAGAALALGPAAALLIAAAGGTGEETRFVWIPAADLEVGLRLDGLSAAMSALVAVAGLAALVHARGYFADSPRAPQAHASLLAFLAAMQGVVLADNFLTLLIFWELVGALSSRLIAYERDDPQASPGAIRAFLTTRSADAGLYIAVAALYAGAGTVAFDAARPEGALGAAVGLGLVLAAAGKSAQVPFQTWLSGAMAGPTPVSALLHSATMVAAGVYLLVRAQGVLGGWPLELAAWLGALTALVAAAFALAQRDLKLILASSTTSQLGLMFVAAGAGAPAAAVFQLVAHAAGKAGAFLAVGIFQRRRGSTALEELRGVARAERAAFGGFALSVASIAAVPPLAAFWSKDAVLAAAEQEPGWFALATLASVGTAAYMLRAVLALARPAASRGGRTPGRSWMLAGVGLLVLGSLTIGALHVPLGDLLGEKVPPPSATTVAVSLLALIAGVGLVAARPRVASVLASATERQWLTNEALGAAVVRPTLRLAAGAAWIDGRIDSGVDAVGRSAVGLAGGSDAVERRGIDVAVDGLARVVERAGGELPRVQGGQLYRYLRNTVAGMAALAMVFAIAAIG